MKRPTLPRTPSGSDRRGQLTQRRVAHDGVIVLGVRYNSAALQDLRHRSAVRGSGRSRVVVPVRRRGDRVDHVYVHDRALGEWLRVPMVQTLGRAASQTSLTAV